MTLLRDSGWVVTVLPKVREQIINQVSSFDGHIAPRPVLDRWLHDFADELPELKQCHLENASERLSRNNEQQRS